MPELFIDGECVKKMLIQNNDGRAVINTQAIKVKYSQMRQQWISGLPNTSHSMLLGDLMLLLVALGAVEYEQFKQENSDVSCMKFCDQYGIRHKAIIEARKLRKQLVNTVNVLFPNLNLTIDPTMAPPSQEQAKLLRQLVLSGMVDRIAK